MPSLLSLPGTLIALVMMASSCLAGVLTEIPSAGRNKKPLPAYVARPLGAGPFPAVILLHGCGGINSVSVGWADQLASWGYVALAIHSLAPRGETTACSSGSREQPFDAYQGLTFLASQRFVRADRIAVLGTSMGAGAVLAALERGLIEPLFAAKFRSGVAFYPRCIGMSGIMTAPTLVGLARARVQGTRSGKPIGRPTLPHKVRDAAQAALLSGASVRVASRASGASLGSVATLRKELIASGQIAPQ